MRKTVAKTTSTKKETSTKTTKRKTITGTLNFNVNGTEIELELQGKVSQTGKTVVFRSTKEDYLENGLGCNVWIDLDLI